MKSILSIITSVILLVSCAKETDICTYQSAKDVSVNLSLNPLAINDPLSINQDQTFGSIAIYVYNDNTSSTLEHSLLLPSFSPISTWEIPMTVSEGVKSIYVIANYIGKTFRSTNGTIINLDQNTTKQQLEGITVENSGGFSPQALIMIGKQTLPITSADKHKIINIDLRRLQSRIDVHIYKGTNFGSSAVTLESVSLHNQVLNSEVKFDYNESSAAMLTSPMLNNPIVTNTSPLSAYTVGTVLQPSDAEAIFYSYQNLVTVLSPLQITAPHLEVKIKSNGTIYTYNGYITDNNQTVNKYSLLQNNVYRILAVLDVDTKMMLNMTVLPWGKKDIEYERPITANDFSFDAWGNSWGGLNGKTMNTNVGGLEDAAFKFELKAPLGARWTATLTNGLDFAFASSTAGITNQAVSNGFTAVGSPSLIVVRASKRWTGDSHDTEFYITVEGNEIPINPIIGSQRRYEGTDTRIKIKQVASYN